MPVSWPRWLGLKGRWDCHFPPGFAPLVEFEFADRDSSMRDNACVFGLRLNVHWPSFKAAGAQEEDSGFREEAVEMHHCKPRNPCVDM